MKLPPKNVHWPQKPLLSPETPPLSKAEASEAIRVIGELEKLDRMEERLRARIEARRKLLVERICQIPSRN